MPPLPVFDAKYGDDHGEPIGYATTESEAIALMNQSFEGYDDVTPVTAAQHWPVRGRGECWFILAGGDSV